MQSYGGAQYKLSPSQAAMHSDEDELDITKILLESYAQLQSVYTVQFYYS